MSKLEKVEVESEVARVIVRLATRGVPSTPNIELKKATWNGMPFGVRRVTLRGGELVVAVRNGAENAIGPNAEEDALEGSGPDWALDAEYARASNWNLETGITTLRCAQWKASSRQEPTRYWVCETACSLPPMPGNLPIMLKRGKRRSLSRTAVHLRGRYHYYFVPVDRRIVRLLIDVGASVEIDFVAVRADFLALQFVLGTGFNTQLLTGLDKKSRPIALASYMLGSPSAGPRAEWPVPCAHVTETWSAPFCERICEVDAARPELKLRIPLSFYVASLYAPVLELKYLLLQVATEATAHWYLKTRGVEEVEIVAKTKWRAWTALHADAVKELAEAGMAEVLLRNVKSAHRHASGRHVAKAFELFEITPPAEVIEEISDGRGAMIHQATMFDEPQNAAEPYVRRVAIVRATLVALVARIVGYDGPITGWTSRPGHAYEPAGEWWPHDGAAAGVLARRDYVCEGKLPRGCAGKA